MKRLASNRADLLVRLRDIHYARLYIAEVLHAKDDVFLLAVKDVYDAHTLLVSPAPPTETPEKCGECGGSRLQYLRTTYGRKWMQCPACNGTGQKADAEAKK